MQTDNFAIRNYKEEDIPLIVDLIKQAFAEYSGKLDPPSSAERKSVQVVKDELREANALVTETEGTLVGCVFYHPREDSIYVDRLSVLPEYRKRGIATGLIAEVEHRARADGYTRLALSVRLALEKQQAFYQRQGFEFHTYGTHEGYENPTYMNMVKSVR